MNTNPIINFGQYSGYKAECSPIGRRESESYPNTGGQNMANLFKTAAQKAAKEAKETKPKGTTIELPKELDAEKKLTGESEKLHQAVSDLLLADTDTKAAKNLSGLAKGVLNRFVKPEVTRRMAVANQMPPGPIKIVNHLGESATFVVQDKSGQYPLKTDQVERLVELLGEDGAAQVINDNHIFHFVPDTMNQPLSTEAAERLHETTLALEVPEGEEAPEPFETVADVVFDLVSKAIGESDLLTDDQKECLIESKHVQCLVKGAHNQATSICGQDAAKIEEMFEICSSQLVRYLKA